MLYDKGRLEEAGFHEFKNFVAYVWKVGLHLPPPTRTQCEISEFLQFGPQRCMVQAFRGVGKSFLAGAFIAWGLLLNPNLRNLIVSATKMKSDENSQYIKRLIMEVPLLEPLKPNKDNRTSAISFDVGPSDIDQSPSVKSVGVSGQVTGSRADIILPDDIEIPKNSYTHLLRAKLLTQVSELGAAVLKPLPTSRIIYLGTPQVEESLYTKLPERGYELRVWPAEVPSKPSIYVGRLAPSLQAMIDAGMRAGTPTDPDRFDTLELEARRAEYGVRGYTQQFMLDTTPADQEAHPLKLHDLLVSDLDSTMAHVRYVWGRERNGSTTAIQDLASVGFDGDVYFKPIFESEEMTEYSGSVLYIDPSGRGRDETSYAVVKFLYGQLFLMECGGYKDGYSVETLTKLALTAQKHKVHQIVAEDNFGDGMFTALLTPVVFKLYKCAIEEVHSSGQKELRIIDTLMPVTQSHRLIVDRKVIEEDLKVSEENQNFSLFYQFTRITRDKGCLQHEDRLEAVAGAVMFWAEFMARDTEKAHDEFKEQALLDELRKFKEDMFNTYDPSTNGDYGTSSNDSWA